MKICILTAGKGARMGEYGKIINKSLLPVKNKAILSHTIESFSIDDTFVIALGHNADQVKSYLKIAHPDRKLCFVNVKNFDGSGSGPGLSLLSCKEFLQEPFYYVPGDCIIHTDLKKIKFDNWLGISKIKPSESNAFCNVMLEKNRIVDIHDKEYCHENFAAFTAPLFVSDYEIFWRYLKNQSLIDNEHQISNGLWGLVNESNIYAVNTSWTDLGNLEKFKKIQSKEYGFDFSKPDEFIYFVNDRVIKFFADETIISSRIKKANLKPNIFPKIKQTQKNFYSYSYFHGNTFYDSGNPKSFKNLLNWLDENVWDKKEVELKKFHSLCNEFYFKKTMNRLDSFNASHKGFIFPNSVNSESVPELKKLLKSLSWELICDGIPSFIHGDLNFGNILYQEKPEKFLLIDWRHDFAGVIEFGDLYYDLAKLYAGLIINFQHIRNGMFKIFGNKHVTIEFKTWNKQDEYIKILENYILSKNYNLPKVIMLSGITFLNMAPLHKSPFDQMLIAMGSVLINRGLGDLHRN